MPLIRGHHSFDDQYAQIPNAWLRDSRLSLKAIGLLAQIMSHRPGWNMSIRNLAATNNVGREQIASALKELEALGYIIRTQERGERNKWGEAVYTTCDPMPDEPFAEKPLTEKPLTEKPATGNHATKNTIQLEDQVKEKNLLGKSTKQHLLSESWLPDDRLVGMFVTKWPLLNMSEQTEAFKLHHMAKGSKMADWGLAYQKWMNQAQKWAADKQGSVPSRKIVGDF